MLEVRGLSKSFPIAKRDTDTHADPRREGRQFHAVKQVHFTVAAGAIVGLLGENGAGKTTLLRMLSTAITPSAGTATVGGVDIVASPLLVRQKIGFLSGSTGLYGRLTAREMVAYYGELHGVGRTELSRRMDELFQRLEMTSFIHRRNDQLSTGMKQKVSIARTLIHDPEVIIFDEPTTGLDVAAAELVLRVIEQCRDQKKTVLFSTHHMHEVERLCSQVVVIHRGTLSFSGTVAEMRESTGQTMLDQAFLQLVDKGKGGAQA